jgi:hypothetical protein
VRQQTTSADPAVDPSPAAVDDESAAVDVDETRDRRVSVAEACSIAAASMVGLVALVSLAAAHLRHHTPLVVGAGSVLVVGVVAVVVLTLNRPVLRLDVAGLLPVVVGIGIAAVMLFPGFHYGTGDRDPGAYVEIAAQIQHGHSIQFHDELLSPDLPAGARASRVSPPWPALWQAPHTKDEIFPQFYHLWSALLATAYDAGGWTGLFNTGPLVGLIAVALAVAVARRIAGLPGAWAAAVLLPTNMLQVWQAKYPSAEIFGQMLFLGATAGVVVAIVTGWRSAAALAGLLIGLGYLERADGVIMVLIAWAGVGALLAVRRFDARAAWFTVGLLATLPYGFYQAYHLAGAYTASNSVPSQARIIEAMLALAVIGGVLGWQRRLTAAAVGWATRERTQLVLGTAFFLICGALMLIGGLRRWIFGKDYTSTRTGPRRTFDEISLIRLSWFFTLPGLALLLLGIGFIAVNKWRLDRWVVALPAVGLLTLYCYHVRNSEYLMWSFRRFVTTVVPGMVMLIGCGLALVAVLLNRYLPPIAGRVVIAASLVGLTVFNLSESWPLRSHDENGGSVEVVHEIAALAGSQTGVFVWQDSLYCCNAPWQLFGGPMLTIGHQDSVRLPAPGPKADARLKAYVDYFTAKSRPVFYLGDGLHLDPPDVPGITAQQVRVVGGTLPHWQETFIHRPKGRRDYPYQVVVYRLGAS